MSAMEIGTDPARIRAPLTGIVDAEGGGTAPHPLGGGVVPTQPERTLPAQGSGG
jgi:hypothetical protein